MSEIISLEDLDNRIKHIIGKPAVLEIRWDGDTSEGWYACLSIYTDQDEDFFLGTVGHVNKASLLQGWGEAVCAKYGLVFYFPAGERPDDDCPHWRERHLGVACADCGKLIMKNEQDDICFYCRMDREDREKLRENKRGGKQFIVFLRKEEEYKFLSNKYRWEELTISRFMDAPEQEGTIHIPDLAGLKANFEQLMASLLEQYEPPTQFFKDHHPRYLVTATYNDITYELLLIRIPLHFQIYMLIYEIKEIEKAIAENFSYNILFEEEFDYRGSAMMSFIRSQRQSIKDLAAIHQRFENVLTTGEVMATLQYLVGRKSVVIENGQIRLTPIGKLLMGFGDHSFSPEG